MPNEGEEEDREADDDEELYKHLTRDELVHLLRAAERRRREEEDLGRYSEEEQIRALERRTRDIQAQRLETEARIREIRLETEKIQAQRLEMENLCNGTFYLRIDELFDAVPLVESNEEADLEKHYKNCCRERNNQMLAKYRSSDHPGMLVDYYAETLKQAKQTGNTPAVNHESSSQSSSDQKTRRKILPCSVIDPTTDVGDVAHLVPDSFDNANTFWFVTDFLFGLDDQRSNHERYCLIHGSKPKADEDPSNDQNPSKRETKKRRHDQSGIKHMVPNKILLNCQKYYMNNSPCVLIVPILDVKEAKEWKGGPYDAIALIDSFHDNDDESLGSNNAYYVKTKVRDVAIRTYFMKRGDNASIEDVKMAERLLKSFVKAIIFAQNEIKPKDFFDNKTIPTKGNHDGRCDWLIPKLKANLLQCGMDFPKPVRKIHFVDHSSQGLGHPSPDPLLLVCRAAVIWSQRHGQILAATAEPDDDTWDELDELAAQQFLAWRDEHQAHRNPEGLTITIHNESQSNQPSP